MYRKFLAILIFSIVDQQWMSTGELLNAEGALDGGCSKDDTFCPDKCSCKYSPNLGGLLLNCKNQNLYQVPENLPQDVVELHLSGNKISNLSSNNFVNCSKLQKLHLYTNYISYIKEDTFRHTTNLTELYLNNNKLNIGVKSSSACAQYLGNLTKLKIHNNVYIGDECFLNFTKLERLDLDRSGNVSFGAEFRGVYSSIKQLYVYGDFTQLTNETFKYMTNLTHLSIKSRNTLRKIDSRTLKPLRLLNFLDLGWNNGLGLKEAIVGLTGINYTRIETLKLDNIISYDDDNHVLNENLYRVLSDSKIVSLSMGRNNIIQVKKGLGQALPYLRRINLAYNRLHNAEIIIGELQQMRNLTFSGLSYQAMEFGNSGPQTKNSETDFSNKGELNNQYQHFIQDTEKTQKRHGEELCKISQWVPCPFPCKFRISSNGTLNTDCTYFSSPDKDSWCIPVSQTLKGIDLTASFVKADSNDFWILPQVVFLGNSRQLTQITFRSNSLRRFIGPILFANPSNKTPIAFDISGNYAKCISPDILKLSIERGANISQIIADHNNFGDQLDRDLNGTMLQYYKDLLHLSLSWNNIKTLRQPAFKNLPLLQTLNLSSNSLTAIEFNFSHMERLSDLDLSYNLLTYIKDPILDLLKDLIEKSNTTLYLRGNPIQCNCKTLKFLEFLKWMNDSNHSIPLLEEMYCDFNGTNVLFNRLHDVILPELDFECSSNLLVVVCGSLLAFVSFCVMISVCLHRHRWDIRYCLISFRTRKHAYQRLLDQRKEYIYDAFVSYDHRDSAWITQELLPKLDGTVKFSAIPSATTGNSRFRLCIHGRDFLLGGTIQETIVTSIKKSRKVLIVLSKNFLESKWCKFELEMGLVHGIQRGWNIVVPIMLTPLKLDEMPANLQMLIRKKTYINWEDQEREEFWVRLRAALLDTTERPCVCECGRSIYETSQTSTEEGLSTASANSTRPN